MSPMFFVADWQGKAHRYVRALESAGWRQTGTLSKAAFLLTDMDVLGRRGLVERAHQQGKKSFLYPHAARPNVGWDGLFEPSPHVTANFVIADGHAEILRRYGYPRPLEVTGWALCEQRLFTPTTGEKREGSR